MRGATLSAILVVVSLSVPFSLILFLDTVSPTDVRAKLALLNCAKDEAYLYDVGAILSVLLCIDLLPGFPSRFGLMYEPSIELLSVSLAAS